MNDGVPIVFDGNTSSVKQVGQRHYSRNVGQEYKELHMMIDSQWQRSLVISIKRCFLLLCSETGS